MNAPIARNMMSGNNVSNEWRQYFESLDTERKRHHYAASSVSVIAGGTPVGTIAGVQEWDDGSVYQVPETATTPGYDIQFTFSDVGKINYIASNIHYNGLSTHQVEVQIYDVTATQWKTLFQVPSSLGYNYRFIDFKKDEVDFIDSSKQAKIRLYHVSGGDATHNVYIDYLAIVI